MVVTDFVPSFSLNEMGMIGYEYDTYHYDMSSVYIEVEALFALVSDQGR